MSKNINSLAIIENFAHEGATSRDRINAGRALSAFANLIEECDALAMTPHGHVDSVLQARIAAVRSAVERAKGEE